MLPENSTDKPSAEERLPANIVLIDPLQACALLRIETDDPGGTMQVMASYGDVITLIQNGTAMLPLFQFDTRNGCVFDIVLHILRLRLAPSAT